MQKVMGQPALFTTKFINGVYSNLVRRERLSQITSITICIGLWEVLSRLSKNKLIPSPVASAKALWTLASDGVLLSDSISSMERVLVGFTLAAMAGVGVGLLSGLSYTAKLALTPILEFLRPIPPIAWIPVAIILLGIGDSSAYFVIFIGAFYPIFTNTALGVREVSPIHLDAAKSLGASGRRRYAQVVWPSALPSIFTGFRIGLGFAWMCVIAAEMIAAKSGIGYEIQLNRQLLQLDKVVAGMVAIGVIGLVLSRIMDLVEWLSLPWRRTPARNAVVAQISDEPPKISTVQRHHAIDLSLATEPSEQSGQRIGQYVPGSEGCEVKVEDLCFTYSPDAIVIKGFNLDVKPGEAYCILGPSGVGKTTFLRVLAGLEEPVGGSILVDGKSYQDFKDRITMVFQGSALFPWQTALENVEFALSERMPARERKDTAYLFLDLVGLTEKAGAYPHQLSGGQQQRVGVARALANNPRLLLLDEPLAALDSLTREALQEDISNLLSLQHVTVIIVTHDISEALFMSDRVGVMTPGGGRLVGEVIVSTPRPRDSRFRHTQEFNDLREKLWETIHHGLSQPQNEEHRDGK
jgi:ABC-type nitrate/sulfonate/bicarbonate transport system ATPase subunit/ABC-type nitrate/sulfonate/bicarbonate transport system permease component